MRTLSRPMFRYGGPVKEGIMSGIREPRQNYAWGDKVVKGIYKFFNKSKAPVVLSGGTKPTVAEAIYSKFFPKKLGSLGTTTPGSFGVSDALRRSAGNIIKPGATGATGATGVGEGIVAAGKPLGYFGRDPTVRLAKFGYKALTDPTVQGVMGQTVRFVLSPTGIVVGGLYYANGKFFNKDGQEIDGNELPEGTTIGSLVSQQDGGAGYDSTSNLPKQIDPNVEREQMIKRYEDIADIRGMNKDAAYKSLIEASKIIGESGDFKGDLKSGKLINQLIQATSKQFDKPAQAREAIRSAMLTSDMDKEVNKEKYTKENLILNKQIRALDIAAEQAAEERGGKSIAKDLFELRVENKTKLSSETVQAYARTQGINSTIISITNKDGTSVIPKGGSPIEFFQGLVRKTFGTPENYPPGFYVIDDRLVYLDKLGQITLLDVDN